MLALFRTFRRLRERVDALETSQRKQVTDIMELQTDIHGCIYGSPEYDPTMKSSGLRDQVTENSDAFVRLMEQHRQLRGKFEALCREVGMEMVYVSGHYEARPVPDGDA